MSTHTVLHLASASPRRAQLLGELGLRFVVEPTHVPEDEDPAAPPESLVKANAVAKARALARLRPTALILGCDTTVSPDNKNLNKPADMAEARVMLRCLSGRMHTVYTGVCLIDGQTGETVLEAVTSRVFFRPLDEAVITRYFAVVNPLDKAGAYGIQEGRELIIDRWEGSLANIMGLPVERLAEILAQRGLLEALREIR